MTPIVRAVAALASAQVALTRATSNLVDVVGGMAVHVLSERELDRLGAIIYDAGSLHRTERVEEWEQRWWKAALPKKPGRILVAACGAGRELVWLLERGWEVEGFDPAPSMVRTALARVGGRARVEVLDFAGFIDEAHRRPRFDAVLIGWGGISHCLAGTSRRQLLDACSALCPRGPILVSWQDGEGMHGRHGRAHSLGERLGTALGELRGVGGAWREQVLFLPHAGPTAFLTAADVAALAAAGGRKLVHRGEPMPHGELLPDARAQRAGRLDAAATELLGEVLSQRGRHRMMARGGSMKPAIPSGTEVHLVRAATPSLGDVVAARVHGKLLLHRVVGVDASGGVLLKGDACPAPDGWVAPHDVLGTVQAVDDGSGARPVPPPSASSPRWRRGLLRLARARRALG